MKARRILLSATLLAISAWPVQAQEAPPMPPSAAISIPSNPAVKAAEAARSPGDLQPEQPVVPQLVVPLRADQRSSAAQRDDVVTGQVLDEAARCVAIDRKAERQACLTRVENESRQIEGATLSRR
jgi:hypothetical protein